MKQLIVFSHPNPKSFNRAILETVKKVYENRDDEIIIRNLYVDSFEPRLSANDFIALAQKTTSIDVKAEQEYVSWAENITFIYPTWWHNLPAMLKGWADRVFSYGFGYTYGANGLEGLLKGRKSIIISTCGNPHSFIETNGYFDLYKKLVDESTIGVMGLEVLKHFYFTGIASSTDDIRKEMLNQLTSELPALF